MYTGFVDGINTLFYDANSVIGLVFGDEDAAAGKLIEAIQEQARLHMVSEVYFFPQVISNVAEVHFVKQFQALIEGST